MLVRTGLSLSVATLALAAASPAFAQEADAFAQRLRTVAADQGLQIAYDEATADGSDITLQGFRLEGGPEPTKPQDVTFENVSGSDSEGYSVDTVTYPDIEQDEGPNHISVSGIEIQGLQIAGTGQSGSGSDGGSGTVPTSNTPLFFQSAAIGGIEVDRGDETVFTLSDAMLSNEVQDGGAYNTEIGVDSFTANFSSMEDRQVADFMGEIGYPEASGSVTGSGGWDPQSGRLSLDDLTLSVDDMGELTTNYTITGYTPSFIQQLRELQSQMSAGPEQRQSSSMAIMGLLSQLSLDNVAISFDDQSLTGRLLDYFAEKENASREDLIYDINALMPRYLDFLPSSAFRDDIAGAVTTYLNEPDSFRIALEPSQPVPAAQLVAAAMGAPENLPQLLSLTVSVNGETRASANDSGQ